MHKTFLAAIAITLFAVSLPASADTVEDFSPAGDINVEAQFNSGGGSSDQVTSAVVSAGPVNGANAIDGDSIFVSIDTTNVVNPTGDFGGGVRAATDVIPSSGNPFVAGSAATDFDVVFDMASFGYVPTNFDLFLNFRDADNVNVISQVSINQGTGAFSTAFGALDGAGTTVPVSIGLENFSGLPADVSPLVNAERFQFTLITRAQPDDFTAGAGNVFVVDNLGLTTTAVAGVPEPSSATLIVAGMIGLFSRRRRSA